jgi:putative transcriptional regulator
MLGGAKLTQRRDYLIFMRKQKSLTQKDVVNILKREYNIKITESYYGMIEQGARTPSLNVALAISSIFNANPESIFLTNSTTKCCEKEIPRR